MAQDLCIAAVSADIQPSCDNPKSAGLRKIGYLINKADIVNQATELQRKNVYVSLTLKQGARAYTIYDSAKNSFAGSRTEMQSGEVSNTFNNIMAFAIRDEGPDLSLNVITPLANGEFVGIMEQSWSNDNNGDNRFVIMGMETGLKATSLPRQLTDEASGGAWMVELTETGAGQSGRYVWAGDYETTKAMLDALTQTPTQPQP